MSAMKVSGLMLLLASVAAVAGMASSADNAIVIQDMVRDLRWIIADAGVVVGMLLFAGNETVRCNKV